MPDICLFGLDYLLPCHSYNQGVYSISGILNATVKSTMEQIDPRIYPCYMHLETPQSATVLSP